MTVRLIKQPVKSLPVSHRDPKLRFSLPDRVYAAGRTCEKTWRRGHHPVHPGEALQTDGEPGISVLSETGCQPVQWVKRISWHFHPQWWYFPYFALVFNECLVCLHYCNDSSTQVACTFSQVSMVTVNIFVFNILVDMEYLTLLISSVCKNNGRCHCNIHLLKICSICFMHWHLEFRYSEQS